MKPILDFPRRGARLLKPREYEAVFAARYRRDGRYFRLHVAPSAVTEAPARLGITVSRRVERRAVARNRIKRQVREGFRQVRSTLAGHDFVVIARPEAAAASNAALRADLAALWLRTGAAQLPGTGRAVTIPGSGPAGP